MVLDSVCQGLVRQENTSAATFACKMELQSYNPGHKYLRLVHILNEFFFHHKRIKGISNDIKSS